MLLVEVRPPEGLAGFRGESRAEVGRALLGAAVAPREIRPAAAPPQDFDGFWVAKLRELATVPAEPLVTPDQSGVPGVEYAHLRLNNLDGAHVWAQLARPVAGEKLPALVIFQWASPPYPLQKAWVTDRAAEGWLVLDVEPHDVPADLPQAFYDALPERIKRYPLIGRHSRDESYFLPMYLGDYRAVEYLTTRPDWDGRTLVLMGTSMGGQQSLAVAGLNPRVSAVIANVPSGADVAGPLRGRAPSYPVWEVARPEVLQTASYFDPANFAPRIRARTLVSLGFIDETSTPASVWAAFNGIPGDEEIVPLVDAPHNHLSTPAEVEPWVRRSEAWLRELAAGRGQTPDYLNSALPVPRRVDDLVSRMTLEEKVAQMTDAAPAIERLGVPQYNWWNEALHGFARSGLATVFPQAIGVASTWNEDLVYRMATVISDEARAKHHQYVREGKFGRYQGLTIWSPNINVFRDPRWGRGQETYGEDPYLTGRLAVPFIRGLQGDDPTYFKTIATVKHFAVHSGPEPERHAFDAVVSERDLRETYLPHFEAGIREAGAYSLMCAYNRVYGDAACGSDLLLKDVLRGEWGFQGFVVSDCGAINDIWRSHKIVATVEEASALAVRAGTDLSCGREYRSLAEAVKRGLITEAELDVSLRRLFTARMRLGMFDPPGKVRWAQIPYAVLDQPSHKRLALEVARQSLVLLKNAGGLLPLRKDLGTLAVIGPNADEWMMLLGNYNGTPSDPVTPLRGIRAAVSPGTRVLFAKGSELADGFPTFERVPAGALTGPGGQGGLRVEYFDSYEIQDAPLFEGVDSVLDADWKNRAPREDMNDDAFSVRWTGTLTPRRTGSYQLGLIGNTRFRLWLDDSLVVQSRYSLRDEFGEPRLVNTPAMTLEAGRGHRIRVEAQESYGDAAVRLMWTDPGQDLLGEAVAAAQQADAVVLFLGLTPRLEGEEMRVELDGFHGGDRTALGLPDAQDRLLRRIVAVGKPTVLVLLNGSALGIGWAQDHVPAILEAWYPGQAAGTAIADVLFGDYNPGGRLPVTFYRRVEDLPPFENYAMEGRTYRYFRGKPLYPFGYGLSYTRFQYSGLDASSDAMAPDGGVTVRVDVTNTGDREGDEVVQLYVEHLGSAVPRPIRDLRGFRRITLAPGERRTVEFTLKASSLAYWDEAGHRWVVEEEPVRVAVGASSADLRLNRRIQVRRPR
jgi:beta-glucosidase